jgi:hypothetical protein
VTNLMAGGRVFVSRKKSWGGWGLLIRSPMSPDRFRQSANFISTVYWFSYVVKFSACVVLLYIHLPSGGWFSTETNLSSYFNSKY